MNPVATYLRHAEDVPIATVPLNRATYSAEQYMCVVMPQLHFALSLYSVTIYSYQVLSSISCQLSFQISQLSSEFSILSNQPDLF